MNHSLLQPPGPLFLNVPFNKRWDLLKPTIKALYIDEDLSLPEVIKVMKEQYRFDACSPIQTSIEEMGHFEKCPYGQKEQAFKAIGKRSGGSSSTAVVKYKGERIDKKRLRRYINAKQKQDTEFQLASNIFTNWNLPYAALKYSEYRPVEPFSPFEPNATTPSDLSVSSPLTPRTAPSPINAPSPTMIALRRSILTDRTRLFLQGSHKALFQEIKKQEKKILITWLHQFWMFSFETAKYWGRGSCNWTVDNLAFERYGEYGPSSVASTPRICVGNPGDPATINQNSENLPSQEHGPTQPPQLCYCSIHCLTDSYERLPLADTHLSFHISDARNWMLWPESHSPETFVEKLQLGLGGNTFSNVEVKDLPIAVSQIIKTAKRYPDKLIKEAIVFSIMARNVDVLLQHLTYRLERGNLCHLTPFSGDFPEFPFHLATSYLDGGKTCCQILELLIKNNPDSLRESYINNAGHTILDNLMIAIFKSHTSCLPVTVDDAFKKLNQFDGEEVGICGRWDADSPCVRELLAEGKSSIPFSWKHMFCHTSIQTICHCIGTIFYPRYAPDVNTPSGLFMKTCAHCGMKLHLGPLHTLVLTAFHLARRGCDGENLFGMLACLVCLLVNGANPLQKAHITMEALLGVDTADHCTHQDLDPFEFLKKIPRRLFSTWTENVLLGFEVFSRILQYAQEERVRVSLEAQRRRRRSNRNDFSAFIEYGDDDDEISVEDYSSDEDSEEIDDHYCSHRRPTNFYCESEDIGILWASIQTELLTYRQLKTGDPWLSENFNMQFLLNGISSGRGISIPLVNNEMMGPFCICGTFFDTLDNAGVCLRVSEVSAYHFSNVEDWDRCAFINNL